MHRLAATGNRFSRAGGSEYSAPTASAAATAIVSPAPCVSAMASGSAVAAKTISFAWPSVRSPAAIGRYGLLTRSISTSVIWLTPTIETLTASAATSVASRSGTSPVPAMAYNPTTESAVPMIVCGRLNRHSTSAARSAPCRSTVTATARAEREHGGDRHEGGAGGRAEHEAGGEAQRAGGRVGQRRERAGGRGAWPRLDPAHRERVGHAAVAVPVGGELGRRDVLEPGGAEPALVLGGGGEEHPGTRERAGGAVGRAHGADQTRRPTRLRDPVGIGYAALRVGPVLDRAGGDVAV